ncbi:hypothetical protein [Pedobacter miscanthi]|uniref:Lipocalin-like domain-containing protein n=1 Tax=Pedobacter miscanthi TaxID=2259170 RepID=A0A366KMT9_9SPHI|nr:hypothetical protein [Pedobacter miscanthi]RBQ02840.1 hypothetical protein DRW42_24635 [Pedobacter miscanthi]
MKAQIYILLLAIGLSFGCKKSTTVDVITDGHYTGVLVVTSSVKSVPEITPVSVTLKDGKFDITASGNLKPAAVKGTYTLNNGIGNFVAEGVWTADFDWNRILNGEYDVKSSGVDLTLKRRFKEQANFPPAVSYATLSYEYILKRTD